MAKSTPPRRRQSAAAVARLRQFANDENYGSFEWLVLFGTFSVMALIFFLFTPYTHQLDEIKNTLLFSLTPFLLILCVIGAKFEKMTWRTHATTMLLGLHVLAWVVSWILNPHKLVAERIVWFQLACFTFTGIFAWFMDSENKMRKTMMFFVLVAFGSVVIGLFMNAGQGFTDIIYRHAKQAQWSSEWVTLFYTLAQSREMYSTILNTDFYAAFLVMTIPITLSMFFVEDHLAFKVLAVVTFLFMNVCLFFTGSNDSFMAILVCYILYFLLGFMYVEGWGISKRTLITFFLCGAVLALTIFVLMIPQLSRTWDFKANAIKGRYILWSGAFWPWAYRSDPTMSHINLTSYLFGTGPGGYRFYFPVFRRADYFDNQINNVTTFGHNYYLDVLCETGLFGFYTFMLFYGLVLYYGIKQIRKTENRSHRFYQMAIVCGLAAVALQLIFSPNNRWAVCGMVFWAMFGLSIGMYHLDVPGEEPKQTSDRLRMGPILARGALAFLAVIFLLRSVPQGYWYWKSAVANGLGLKYMEGADNMEGQEKLMMLEYARKYFERAIDQNPTFVTSYYKLAHVYNTLGNTEAAIRKYEELEAINPHYSEIHLNLGIMYSTQADQLTGAKREEMMKKGYEECREAARQELKPNVQAIAAMIGEELAALYDKNGKAADAAKIYEEIKKYYRCILDYQPVLDEYKQERKKYYQKSELKLVALAMITKRNDEAEQVLRRMYEEDPSNREYLSALLGFFDKQSKKTEKLKFLEEAVHNGPMDTYLRKQLADAYLASADMANYQRELRRIEVIEPKSKDALTGLFQAYRTSGNAAKTDEYKKKLQALNIDTDKLTTPAGLQSSTSSMEIMQKLKMEAAKLKMEEEEQDQQAAQPPSAAPEPASAPAEPPSSSAAKPPEALKQPTSATAALTSATSTTKTGK